MRRVLFVVALVIIAFAPPADADDVTIGGNVSFSALDGSVLDHDGLTNGVFTVSDGNLTVLGTVNCNDDGPGNASACSMRFVVSGNMTILGGGALHAENRTGSGSGGTIALEIGENLLLRGNATLSSGADSNDPGGNITIKVIGTTTLDAGSIVSSGSKGGRAGAIAITSNGPIDLNGLLASGPGRALTATVNTGDVLAGSGSSKQQGGTIMVRSTATVSVGASATIVSQGRHNGSSLVLLEGCGLDVRGLVASIAERGTDSAVTLRSGTTIVIDGRDRSSLTGVRRGMVRADSPAGNATTYRVRVLAPDAIQILGPAGSLYALSSNPGANNAGGGTIDVVSTGGTVMIAGNAARAGDTANGDSGGRINIAAKGTVIADTAVIRANGDAPAGAGGAIALRSHSGGVSWQLGTGDVRPAGSSAGVPAERQGTIALTYCTTVSTTGSSFPTDGSAPAFFPTSTQTCSAAAPSLPPGETNLPNCNDAPVATNDAYTVAEGGTLDVPAPGVLTNDFDAAGDPMTAVLVTGPAHASSFILNADGSFTYVHDGGETTSDSFTYRANDGAFDSNIATVAISVSPVNDVPVAVDDASTLAEGGTLHVASPGVLTNDTDPDGPSEIAVLVSGPAHASSFTLNPNGEVLYVHDGSDTTSDSFTYKVNDGLGDSNVATVRLTITAVDDTPLANDDSYSTTEGGTLDVAAPGVLANDVDPAGAPLHATLVSGPAHASSFTLNANGSFTYVHNGSETTTDSFTYRADNGSASSNVATVIISVAPVNDAPVAQDDSYATEEGGTLTISAPGVLGNDSDPDGPTLTAILVSGPAHAAFALNANGSFTYVHDGSETTSDTFTYKADDGSSESNVATVTITIAPANDDPIANDDSYSVSESGSLNVAPAGVLGNDSDPDSSTLTAILVSGPAHSASFALDGNGSFSYVHDGGETTSDSFTYRANDGSLDSNIATVTIHIEPVDDAPIATNESYGVDEGGTLTVAVPGVLGNDTDVDTPTLTAILVSGPAHASSFTLNPGGSFNYVHDGSETTSDSFTYKANDGSSDSNVATVTITIAAVNDAPVASPDAFGVDEGGTLNVPAPGALSNDTDPDSTFTAALVSSPLHGASFVFNSDGSFTYVHDGSDASSDTFTYRTNDGALDSNIASVTINIAPVNDPPIATDDTYGVDEGATLTVAVPGVLGNDTDPDSTLTAILLSGPAHASSFTLNPNGSFQYVHDGSETTSDSFTYKATDGVADSNVATVMINVTAVNDPPTAFAFAGLPAQAGIRITYPAGKLGGTDVEPGTTITIDTTPINVVNGMVTINANGSFVFTPLPAAAGGTASFQYRVSDNGNPPPGVSGAYVTVSFNVAGPAIYFTRSAPVGVANCTLGNECTVAGAVANIGLSPNAHIFIGDAGTQTLASIALNPGGTIIGQAVQAVSFDAFFGIVAPAQGTLAARPVVNQNLPRPVLATTIVLNNSSQVRGLNLTPSNDGLVATGKTGLAVSQLNITSDANLPNNFCLNFVNSSGTFLFGNIAVNAGRNGSGVNFNGSTSATAITFSNVTMGGSGDAVIIANSGSTLFSFQTVSSNSGRAVDINGATGQMVFTTINANGATTGILVQNATGSFTVNGINGNPGTGGTIQNCTLKGADFRASRNIQLRGMNFVGNATVDGPGASCGRIDLSTTNNGPLNCNASISLQSVTSVTLINLIVTGSQQIGIDGQSVNTLAMQGTTVAVNGNDAFEDGVQMSNLSGNVTLNVNNMFRDAAANLFEIVNDSGTMFASFTASTFRYTTFPSASSGSGLHIVGRGSAVVNPFVGSSTFQNINSIAVRVDLSGAASGNIGVGGATNGNTFTNNAQSIGISAVGTGTINYTIRENTLTNDVGVTSAFATTPISASFGGAATRIGTIDNNTIGTNLLAAPASGCFAAGCDGIQLADSAAAGTHRVTVSNNRIFHVNGAAIRVTSSAGSAETLRARITNNIANFPDNPASTASAIVVQDSNATPNGVLMTCLDVTGNQLSGLWAAGTSHKSAIGILATRAQQFSLTNFTTATDYAAGAVTPGCTTECTGPAGFDGNAADFLSQQNPATVTAQSLSGGSSASQQRLAASAPWTGTSGVCP